VSPQVIGGSYCLKIDGVESSLGTLLEPSVTNVCFSAFVASVGLVSQELYMGITGGTLAELRASAKYPNAPDSVRFRGTAQANTFDEFDNYGTRISGYIRPPVSGNYNFFMSSDDNGELWLSTDENPANIQLLASEPQWNGRRDWTGTARRSATAPENRSSTLFPAGIPLEAGKMYYFETLMKEGGGGDNLAMTWQLPGAPLPDGTTPPLGGDYIATLTDPNGSITIVTQPVDRSAEENTVVNFSVVATGTASGLPTTDIYYQWQRQRPGGEWTPIPNAVGAAYGPTVTLADNGSKYRVRIYVPGAAATSAEVSLDVYHINTAPKYTCNPVPGALEDSGAHNVPGAITGIVPHSIVRTPVVLASAFASGAGLDLRGGESTGTHIWTATVADGVLKLTTPVNSTYGAASAPVPQNTYESLQVTWKSLVGGGADGADGYSLNIGDDLPLDPGYGGEDGVGAGLRVTVDTFDNGGLEDGIGVVWRGSTVAFQHITKNDDGSGVYLRKNTFVDAAFSVDATGVATLTYDGQTISGQLPAYAGLSINRALLWARTGGANDNHWIDDFSLSAFPFDASSSELIQTVAFTASNDNPSLFTAQPAVGADGTLSYALAPNACGVANVTVVGKDNGGTAHGGNDTGAPCTLVINVSCINDCPIANGQSISVEVGSSVAFQLVGTDVDNPTLTYAVAQAAAHGVLTVNLNTGAGTYVPSAGYTGPDSFTFTVSDGTCISQPATVAITVRSSNTAPIAKIHATGLVDFSPDIVNKVLISGNGSNACLSLDGLQSTDAETPTALLTYQWFLSPSPLPFDTGIEIETCLDVGTHTIVLAVTDPGNLTGTDSLTIDVLSAGEAIEELVTEINDSTIARGNKRPFIATLKAAAASADRGNNESAANQLHALQNKLRAQVAKDNPAEAARWIALIQAIIDAMEGP
jgi:hypothetical protein